MSSRCPHNMVNFGPLAAEIGPVVWGTPENLNGFRVLAALLHGTPVLGVSQTLRRLTEGATYIRQGGHHVGQWPTFLVHFDMLSFSSKIAVPSQNFFKTSRHTRIPSPKHPEKNLEVRTCSARCMRLCCMWLTCCNAEIQTRCLPRSRVVQLVVCQLLVTWPTQRSLWWRRHVVSINRWRHWIMTFNCRVSVVLESRKRVE